MTKNKSTDKSTDKSTKTAEALGERGIIYGGLKFAVVLCFSIVLVGRGEAYGELKRYANTLADYTKTLESDPKNVDALVMRGLVYIHLKRYADAVADYTKVLEIDPKNEDARSARDRLLD